MVQSVNVDEEELELINQFLVNLEAIVNEKKLTELETILAGHGLEGVIQAFLSMIISNFDQSIARFRVYPRFIKKLKDGRIRIHSSTRISPTENMDITWTLNYPSGEFQRFIIESMNSMTVPIYEESLTNRIEIPNLDSNWKGFMRTYQRVENTNKIYMKLVEVLGKQKTKEFFDDSQEFCYEVDNLFGFLEGQFKIISYIGVIGSNVNGWKGVIMKNNSDYEVVFDDYRDLEALESIPTSSKMTEQEYLDLITYQWEQRLKPFNLKMELDIDKSKRRIIFKIMKKPPKIQKGKNLVKGERTTKIEKEKSKN